MAKLEIISLPVEDPRVGGGAKGGWPSMDIDGNSYNRAYGYKQCYGAKGYFVVVPNGRLVEFRVAGLQPPPEPIAESDPDAEIDNDE